MRLLGNIIWFILGGLSGAVGWFLAGLLWSVTIIGIPIGLQCFKLAALSLWPFNKEVIYSSSSGYFIMNLLWLLISGIPLAIGHMISGILLSITIIGIPFGKQSFKLARLALMPFGAQVVPANRY